MDADTGRRAVWLVSRLVGRRASRSAGRFAGLINFWTGRSVSWLPGLDDFWEGQLLDAPVNNFSQELSLK